MPRAYQGWVTLRDAAGRLGLHYEVVRRMVKAGVFTRGKFSGADKRPPIYLRNDELRAWRKGGSEAVQRLRHERITAGK